MPSFDGTGRDVDVFKMISDWLHYTYRRGIYVTGVLYFHRISDSRMAGTALENLRLLEGLCGEEFNEIVITTTMWNEVDERTGHHRQNDLKNSYWKAMVERGASIRRFLFTRPSAFEVLEPILRGVNRPKPFLIQREIEDLGLRLNQTRVGQTLLLQPEELIGTHEEKLNRIRSELRDPTLTPTKLRLLMEDYQKISKPPTNFKLIIDTVFRPKTPRPPSRLEKAPAPPMVQDRERRLPQSIPEEDIVLPRRNPTTSGSSTSSSRSPSSLYRPWSPQSLDTMAGSSSNQPEYMSSSSLSSRGFSRSTSQRSVPNQNNIPPNQRPPAWGIPPLTNQHTPPPRSYTVYPSSPSQLRASTPHTDRNSGLHQGVPSLQYDLPPMTARRISAQLPNNNDLDQSSQDSPPPVPKFPWL